MYPSLESSINSDLELIAWYFSTTKANNSGGMAMFGIMAFKRHCVIDIYFKGFSIRHSKSSFRDGGKMAVPVSILFREG